MQPLPCLNDRFLKQEEDGLKGYILRCPGFWTSLRTFLARAIGAEGHLALRLLALETQRPTYTRDPKSGSLKLGTFRH